MNSEEPMNAAPFNRMVTFAQPKPFIKTDN
jgi:hypothetical protein